MSWLLIKAFPVLNTHPHQNWDDVGLILQHPSIVLSPWFSELWLMECQSWLGFYSILNHRFTQNRCPGSQGVRSAIVTHFSLLERDSILWCWGRSHLCMVLPLESSPSGSEGVLNCSYSWRNELESLPILGQSYSLQRTGAVFIQHIQLKPHRSYHGCFVIRFSCILNRQAWAWIVVLSLWPQNPFLGSACICLSAFWSNGWLQMGSPHPSVELLSSSFPHN